MSINKLTKYFAIPVIVGSLLAGACSPQNDLEAKILEEPITYDLVEPSQLDPPPKPLQSHILQQQEIPAINSEDKTTSPTNYFMPHLPDYTLLVKQIVSEYNQNHPSIEPLDWRVVNQMILKESGTSEEAYKHDPMQIANKGDYALNVLTGRQKYEHIKDPKEIEKARKLDKLKVSLIGDFGFLEDNNHTPWKNRKWDYSNSNMTPEESIRGGVGWLFYNAIEGIDYSIKENDDAFTVIVDGDKKACWDNTLWGIADRCGSTVDTIKNHNPSARDGVILNVGEVLTFPSVTRIPYISEWSSWENAVKSYNGGGNPNYLNEVYASLPELRGNENGL